jgi:hypothetical protein
VEYYETQSPKGIFRKEKPKERQDNDNNEVNMYVMSRVSDST